MWNKTVWLVWMIILPLALFVGYLLATPDTTMSFGVVSLLVFTLSIPLVLRWHYPILLFSWSAYLVLFFLPGHPFLWMLTTLLSLTISVFRRSINKTENFIKTPSIALPLMFFGAVVLITAKLTGGIGVAALGSESYGGKRYVYIFGAILGYFALTSQSIAASRAKKYTVLFLISGLTAIISNLAYIGGPSFYFLFAFFPVEFAATQAIGEQSMTGLVRLSGLTFGCMALYCTLLGIYGVRGILDTHKIWRIGLVLLTGVASLLAGFRSSVIAFALLFFLLFCLEGLYRTRWLPITILGAVLMATVTLPFVSKMPFSVQRALSILPLPLEIDPAVQQNAVNSSEWRLDMWKVLAPEIPEYFWLGKGYSINPSDLYLTEELQRLGLASPNEWAIVSGDYHSGPLSLIITFGFFGTIGFVWFLIACLRALYCNYKFGNAELRKINALLFAYFLTRVFFFLFIYGSVSDDILLFVGIIGFNISLNNGIVRCIEDLPIKSTRSFETSALSPA